MLGSSDTSRAGIRHSKASTNRRAAVGSFRPDEAFTSRGVSRMPSTMPTKMTLRISTSLFILVSVRWLGSSSAWSMRWMACGKMARVGKTMKGIAVHIRNNAERALPMPRSCPSQARLRARARMPTNRTYCPSQLSTNWPSSGKRMTSGNENHDRQSRHSASGTFSRSLNTQGMQPQDNEQSHQQSTDERGGQGGDHARLGVNGWSLIIVFAERSTILAIRHWALGAEIGH